MYHIKYNVFQSAMTEDLSRLLEGRVALFSSHFSSYPEHLLYWICHDYVTGIALYKE